MTHMQCSTGFALWLTLLGVTCVTLVGGAFALLGPDWFGAGRYRTHPIPLGEAMPTPDNTLSRPVPRPSAEGQATINEWSERTLPDWRSQGKVTAPRVVLAKLMRNHDIEEVNRYLRAVKPWSGVGSNWTLHYGDYDFSLVTLTTILYMFGEQPDRLYPETRQYLLDTLLTEEGGSPLVAVPRTAGLILDTENHHLMTEGSRYLKNQWLARHGTDAQRAAPGYDNVANGLEEWFVAYLEEMRDEGVYEFNSRPYAGYMTQALLNLEAWPESPRIRSLARYLLDIVNLQYALGSHGLRCYPPFRRNYREEHITALHYDPLTAFMRIWTDAAYAPDAPPAATGHRTHLTLLAELLPYRPPEAVLAWTRAKPEEYFVRYGRGASACPELYSGGPDYLLSAGGANRGFRSFIIVRPITLLLNDDETEISRCLHLSGRGHWRQWNNTGVHRRFACANGPAHIPEQMSPEATADGWHILRASHARNLLIAVYSADMFSMMALFPDSEREPEALLGALREKNGDDGVIRKQFVWPDGTTLAYDVQAPKGVWVMESVNGEALDRDYDAWPQLSGDGPDISFAR